MKIRVNDTKSFIEKAKIVHGDRYSYERTVYKNSYSKLIITCKKHGDFLQQANSHVQGRNCFKCRKEEESTSKRMSQDEWISRCNKKHNGIYDYSESDFIGMNKKVKIICKEHGYFYQLASTHVNGANCYKCRGVTFHNTNSFKEAANIKHNGKYCYDKVIYINSSTKITITCKIHGDFSQSPENHLRNMNGCPKCSVGYLETRRRSSYVNTCNEKYKGRSNLYLLEVYGNNESFYKIGITAHQINNRFGKKKFPYEFFVMAFLNLDSGYAWDNEKILHRLNKRFKYKPKIKFGGYTECFSDLTPEVLEFFGVDYAA